MCRRAPVMSTLDVKLSSEKAAPEQSSDGVTSQITMRRIAAGIRDYLVGAPRWYRYRIIQPRTIVVLGMHRSGTSWLARVVNLCGASLGGAVAGPNPWNQTGHWESFEGLAINDLILSLSGG